MISYSRKIVDLQISQGTYLWFKVQSCLMKIDECKLTNASPNKRFIIGTFEEKAQDGNAISF